jgi:hypothetical protein
MDPTTRRSWSRAFIAALAAFAASTLAGGCQATYTRRATVREVEVARPAPRTYEVRTVYAYDPPPASYWWHDGWHAYPHPGSCSCEGGSFRTTYSYYGGYSYSRYRPYYGSTYYGSPYSHRSGYCAPTYRAPARSSGFRGRVVVGR